MNNTQSSAAVIGLGPMGSALAAALLDAGEPTTVWSRTRERALPFAERGAVVADDAAAAVASAPVVIVCVRDHAAAREVLTAAEPDDSRVIVNLSSSTPNEAKASADWASDRGLAYLSGAIMVPTPLIGSSEAVILYSGGEEQFHRVSDTLRHVAGTANYLGEDPGLAALYDVAMLEIFFAGMTSFLHAAAMMTAGGVSASDFVPAAVHMAELAGSSFAGLAADVDSGHHNGAEDTIVMERAALDHIVAASGEAHLDGRLATYMRDVADEAIRRGHSLDAWSRVIDVIRESERSARSR